MPSKNSEEKKTRTYNSPRRQEQAHVTRTRIIEAALNQLQEKGYADMTLESIAREAGVACQTVYAVCGSKKEVLTAILEHTVQAQKYDTYRDRIPEVKDPEGRAQALAHFHALLQHDNAPGFQIIRGMGVVSPELGELEQDREATLYAKAMTTIVALNNDKLLRPELDLNTACDILWALTSTGNYVRLVNQRGWPLKRYQEWLANMIKFNLIADDASSAASHAATSQDSQADTKKTEKKNIKK